MASKKFTTIIIIVNAIMGLLIFLSSQLILLTLNGYVVGKVDFLIHYDVADKLTTMATLPIPNFPLLIFIFALIANSYFLIRLRRSKE